MTDAVGEFRPYENDAQSLDLHGLTIENQGGNVAVHGSIDLPQDREGLARAIELKRAVDSIVAALSTMDLPEKDEGSVPPTPVENPFG